MARRTRLKAFKLPAPEGWVPEPGECVWLSPSTSHSTAIVRYVQVVGSDGIASVLVHFRRIKTRIIEKQFLLSDLRPCPYEGSTEEQLTQRTRFRYDPKRRKRDK